MRELRAWIVLAWRFVLYFSYRSGLCKCPAFMDIYPEGVIVFDRLMRWPERLRVEGAEHCPLHGPAVFAGNHQKKDDPFIMYRAIHRVRLRAYVVYYMMRDDFFKGMGAWAKSWFLDVDELARLVGTYQISRDNVQLSQMKPFVRMLRDNEAFIIYPGRSRTRSGLFMEYRDGIEEPGGVTFFIAQAQRGRPDLKVPAVTVTRTYNPVNKKSTIVFGEPQFLPHDADRASQRELDLRLIEVMAENLEINVPQIVAGLLYLYCLHNIQATLTIDKLESAARSVIDAIPNRRIDPAAKSDLPGEVRATLQFFQERNMLTLSGSTVEPNRDAIRSAPEPDTNYIKLNPVKHLVNQVLHLNIVVAAIESAAGRLSTD